MSNSSTFHFWTKEGVVTITIPFSEDIPHEYRGLWCVDTHFKNPYERYGKWEQVSGQWISGELESMPPESRTHLLLMGIT